MNIAKTIRTMARCRDPRYRRAMMETFAIRKILGKPVCMRDRNGFEYIVHPDERIDLLLLNGYLGVSEIGEQEFCRKTLKPGMTVFDVGAHIGQFTLLFASLVGAAGRVFSFEPSPQTMRRLRAHIVLNGFDNVYTEQSAVYSSHGSVVEFSIFPPGRSVLNTLGNPKKRLRGSPGRMIEPEQRLSVRTVTIDRFCEERGIERIDFLKVDVEGAELHVLRGCGEMLRRKAIGHVQFEISEDMIKGMNTKRRDVFTFLEELGYLCHPVTEQGELRAPVHDTNAYFANFIAIPL